MAGASSFSIVIDNYNYAHFLERALASALDQDYPHALMEIIVVDDGSTDASRDILRRYADDPRVTVILQENAGQAAAFARGVERATRDYVCLLDSDDAFFRGKLNTLDEFIAGLDARGADLFLCHDLQIYDEAQGAALPSTWFQRLQLEGPDLMTIEQVDSAYPFAIPSGQVYTRALLTEILEAIPLAEWRTGADNPIVHAALLRAGAVHFLHAPLAQYSIHGQNRLLAIENHRAVNRPEAQNRLLQRRPKLLWFLERYLDTLPYGRGERQERIAYLKRLEATRPVSAAPAAAPVSKLSFIVAPTDSESALCATLEAIARQTHENCEVLVIAPAESALREVVARFAAAHRSIAWLTIGHESGRNHALLTAMKQAQGKFLALIAAGDRPDRAFAERHHFYHRYLTLTMVTACDFRLEDGGETVQDRCYGASRLWPERRRFSLFPKPVPKLGSWFFCPRSGNVLRRNQTLDWFLDYALEHGVPEGVPAEWLLMHYAAALGGCTQFAECLTTLQLESAGDPVTMHLRDLVDARFLPRLPQPQAAIFYLRLLSRYYTQFQASYDQHWKRFVTWAVDVDGLHRRSDIKAAVLKADLHPAVAAVAAQL